MKTLEPRDIVVTGVGLVSPLGATRELTWANLIAGRSGIVPTENGLEARVTDFSPNGARSRTGDFALLAAREALEHAGLLDEELRAMTVGCAVSQSKPILGDPSLLLSSFTGWSVESVIARDLALSGPTTNAIAACATGVASIDVAAYWVRSGLCDAALAGAAESSLNSFYRAGFQQMGVLAAGGPERVCPFDARRSGFAMGEGAAVLVLESRAVAERRSARALARVSAVAMTHGGGDLLRFDANGSAVARLIGLTMRGELPGYVNAHGTGTIFNDRVETAGLRRTFGADAERVPVSSTKAATGHLLGAAGAVEAAFCVLALRDQIIPPTLNLRDRDPECDLDYVPLEARAGCFRTALSLSYGFGGQMGGVMFDLI